MITNRKIILRFRQGAVRSIPHRRGSPKDRTCTRCHRSFGAGDLVKSVSKGMEADRKAAGLEGVRFLDYHCPECGTDSIFVDILPRDGEEAEQYRGRRQEMEKVVRGLQAERVDAVTVAVSEPVGG